jgi:putative colanic acid biosynthesis acetyltransferase WcaF
LLLPEIKMPEIRLDLFNNDWYHPGAGWFKRTLWYFCNVLLFKNGWIPFSGLRIRILKIFGASIGKGVVLKPCVNIKYPWLLVIGDHCWIGENVWIDNLATVLIEDHVCISQGAFLLTGNHNFKDSAFGLMTGKIHLCHGVWIGAKTIVCPGVKAEAGSVLTAGSVATKNLLPWQIYQGNPAQPIKQRIISE